MCNSNEIEDEFHFLTKCSRYLDLRTTFLPSLALNPSYDNFISHMQCSNKIYNISNFLSHATNRRKKLYEVTVL